ncbi:hypothetical protein DAEQUDRAFT_763541 [Daedalea quercina L-15889]|uniref:Uncharacterized protein n=1 Tax=Daedalea quercina L-15889 TaxID=1314783 RepID=A0A165S974_9APHY|nr:hypothetical protein DAEQUDRAFT_763541 [Daedalea quercina L-15889]
MSTDIRLSLPPPPYSVADHRTQQLKDCFASLVNEQFQIQRLFDTVAERLQTIPQIGSHHPLAEEWTTLRQLHRKTYRDSQEQASRCADFLSHFLEVVIPLTASDIPILEKQTLTKQFIEDVGRYRLEAQQCSEQFDNLKTRIESFRIKCGLQTARAPQGFWSKVKDFCVAIGQAIDRLLSHIVNLFRRSLRYVHVEIGERNTSGHLSMDIFFDEYSQLPEEYEMRPQGATAEIDAAARTLESKLGGFEDAWDAVRKSCDTLRTRLALADTVTGSLPYYESCLTNARRQYMALRECMTAYAQGRTPNF